MNPHIIRFLLITILFTSCSKRVKPLFSDLKYERIPKVKLSPYKSPQERKNQDESLALGVALAGGGTRAQYFTMGVMMSLDEIKYTKANNSSFLNEVDYISAVSGGSLGAGYYLALKKNGVLKDYLNFHQFWISNIRKEKLQSYISQGTHVLWNISRLWWFEWTKRNPLPTKIDVHLLQKGKTYTLASSSNKQTIKKLFLSDFFIPENASEEVTMPIFVANGTILNNGERLPIMPHIIDHFKIKGSIIPKDQDSFGNLDNGYGFPLNYAITCSNSFPGIVPISKFELEKNKDVLRIIDGGVVDNFGIKTLLELLKEDTIKYERKRVLIVDCKGDFDGAQLQHKERIRLIPLLKSALFYTLTTRHLTSNEDIDIFANHYNIKRSNIYKIGFSSIKKKYDVMVLTADPNSKNKLEGFKIKLKEERAKWFSKNKRDKIYYKPKKEKKWTKNPEVYYDFIADLDNSGKFGDVTKDNISEIPTEKFSEFSLSQVFMIYELSAQIDTKLGIYPWEKQILVLAGRYAVHLEKEKILKLLED